MTLVNCYYSILKFMILNIIIGELMILNIIIYCTFFNYEILFEFDRKWSGFIVVILQLYGYFIWIFMDIYMDMDIFKFLFIGVFVTLGLTRSNSSNHSMTDHHGFPNDQIKASTLSEFCKLYNFFQLDKFEQI